MGAGNRAYPRLIQKERRIKISVFFLAQREGFEPPETLVSTVFKTAAIDHSTISALLIQFVLGAHIYIIIPAQRKNVKRFVGQGIELFKKAARFLFETRRLTFYSFLP